MELPVSAATRPRWVGIDPSLRDEGCVRPDPWLRRVDEFEGILFFVLPFHVFLLVADGIPPDVEEAIGPV